MKNSTNPNIANPQQRKRISFEKNNDDLREKQLLRVREMFPFADPYPQQIESMDVILQCLNDRKNLLLECPTGTGKSLMLLTSIFSFIEANPSQYQILFLTKTNGQVNGLVKELSKIRDADELTSRYAILAGRSQLCIKKESFQQFLNESNLKNSSSKNINKKYESFCTDCKKTLIKSGTRTNIENTRLVDVSIPIDLSIQNKQENEPLIERACENFAIAEMANDSDYKFKGFSKVEFNPQKSNNVSRLPDIEDMAHIFSATNSQCPFYFNRYIAKQAHLVFMNYNYLLNPDILNYVSKNVIDNHKRSIIVFDEAHNIEQQAEAQFQTKLKMSTIKKVLSLLFQIQTTLRLAHTLRITDMVLEQGMILLDKMKEAAMKSERVESKIPDNSPPFEINLKVEEAIENQIIPCTNKNLTDTSQNQQQACQKSDQILKEILPNLCEQINSNIDGLGKKETHEDCSSVHLIDSKIKLEEEDIEEISQNIVCSDISVQNEIPVIAQSQSKTEEEDDNLFEEELAGFIENLRQEQRKQIVGDEYLEISDRSVTVHDSQSQPEQQQQQSEEFESITQKFEKQKAVLKDFFENYESILPQLIAYLGSLDRFCERRLQKSMKPECSLMSEFHFIQIYYKLFGLITCPTNVSSPFEDSNKENENAKIKEEDMKSILIKVDEMYSQQENIPSPCEVYLKLLETVDEFAGIFHAVIRFIKIKYAKLNQNNDVQQFLASVAFCEGNLLQLKVSFRFFANTLQQLSHLPKIKKVYSFISEMQQFFELSILQQKSKKKQRNSSFYSSEECFNIESQDLQKLQDFYLSVESVEQNKKNIVFTLGCLSGKYAFRSIQANLNVHSVIMCSATLAPFDILMKNLDTKFQTYSSSHVINPVKQLFTKFVSHFGEKGEELNFSFGKHYMDDSEIAEKNFQNVVNALDIIHQIVTTIISNQNSNGGGVIVFFKSYELMRSFHNVFLRSASHQALDKVPVFVEKINNKAFQEDFTIFRKQVQVKKRTCLFFAACRGKLSEGIDLSDDLARSVIVVGMPFWNISDPYFICKKRYIERVLKMNPQEWHRKQVMKFVNQAAGRSIRHKNDWGSVFFICKTFTQSSWTGNFKDLVSPWILEAENHSTDFIGDFNNFIETQMVSTHQVVSQ